MVAKKDKYTWSNGASIDDHTRTKHNILRQYLASYFDVRLANPQIREFKFAIVDGFSGGGRYATGEPGSPLIILDDVLPFLYPLKRRVPCFYGLMVM